MPGQPLPHLGTEEAQLRDAHQAINIEPGVRPAEQVFGFVHRLLRKLGGAGEGKDGAAQPGAEGHAGHGIERADQALNLEPGVARQPFVGAFAGEGNLVTVGPH